MKVLLAAWVSVFLAGSLAFGQEADDPADQGVDLQRRTVRIQVEYVELSHKDLTRLLMEDEPTSTDATVLRMKVHEMSGKDEAKVINTQMVAIQNGLKSTSESVHEFMFPTEYEPLSLPSHPPAEKTQLDSSRLPLGMPTAFETRNLGSTLEGEPDVRSDGKTIDLRIASVFVWHTGDSSWNERQDKLGNITKITMPNFYMIAINTTVVCMDGKYVLVGVVSPKDAKGNVDTERKVMVFAKCNVLHTIP